jgi:hypothetical protein
VVKDALQWSCLPCTWRYGPNFKHHGSGPASTLQISNLQAHARLPRHISAVEKLAAAAGVPRVCSEEAGAPPLNIFRGVLRQFRQGVAPGGAEGYQVEGCIIGRVKVDHIVWTLGEALLHKDQETLRRASVVCLSRDERHGKLHCRWRSANDDLVRHSGYLGQSRNYRPDSIGINAAQLTVYKAFCTRFVGSPLQEVFDEDLFKHMLAITECLSVDSASSEIASHNDNSQPHSLFAACKHIMRDAAHSIRRIIGRGWGGDNTMKRTADFFCWARGSMAQLIQHSIDIRHLFDYSPVENQWDRQQTCLHKSRPIY